LLAVVLSAALIFQAVPAFAAELPAPETEGYEVSIDPVEVPVLRDGEETATITDTYYSDPNYIGYAATTVYFNVEVSEALKNRVYSLPAGFVITEGEYSGSTIGAYYTEQKFTLDDGTQKSYNFYVDVPTAGKDVKGYVAVWPFGDDKHESEALDKSDEMTLKPVGLSEFSKVEVSAKGRVLTADFNATLEKVFSPDMYAVFVYMRKKGEEAYQFAESISGKYSNFHTFTPKFQLEPDTEYEYYATARIEYNDPVKGIVATLDGSEKTYGTAAAPKSFKTLENKIYSESDFEDPVFYKWLLKGYGNRSGNDGEDELSSSDMDTVNSIDRDLVTRPKDFAPFTSIKGIENFPWIEAVSLKYNDLTSIPEGDWIKKLQTLDLTGNLITEIPDLSHMEAYQLRLERNCLTKEAVTDKLPKDMDEKELLAAQQNKDEKLEITSPDIFYPIGSSRPFFIYPNNNVLRGGRDYSMTATLDGKVIESQSVDTGWETVGNTFAGPWFVSDLNSKDLTISDGDTKEIGIKVYSTDFYDNKKEEYSGTVKATFKSGSDFRYSLTNMRHYQAENDPTDPYSEAPSIKIDGHAFVLSSWIDEYKNTARNSFSKEYSNLKLLDSEGNVIPLREVSGIKEGYDIGAYMDTGERRYDNYMFEEPPEIIPIEGVMDIYTVFIFLTIYPAEKLAPGKYSVSVDVNGGETLFIKDVIIVDENGEQSRDDEGEKGEEGGGSISENTAPKEPEKVPVAEGASYASENDNFAPVTSTQKLNKQVLNFTNVPAELREKLTMTTAKGSKFTTDPGVKFKDAQSSDKKAVKAKLNKKNGVATVTPKKGTAIVTFTTEDDVVYKLSFTVDSMKAIKSAKSMPVSETPQTLYIKDLFDTSINDGELSITGGNSKSQATVSDNKLCITITPKEKDKLKIQFQYLNKKYKTSIKIG
ncbi:MAG: leucine-rich repeat domain-containing protein, partial [Lachnospiraceae bacterium]|nr:leucine-rich repeat domain-containing protein [Lachnospiraceae bacterium]